MRILLVLPSFIPLEKEVHDGLKVVTDLTPPLGILYLGTVLKEKNYDVTLFDHSVRNIPIIKVAKWIVKHFDIIGFSVLTSTLKTAIKISEEIKKLNKDTIIIFGGVLATIIADKIMNKYNIVDFCVRGEGEYTLINLLECIKSNNNPKNYRGITYRENGIVKSTPNAPLIDNLDELPIPDRSLIFKSYKYQLSGLVTPMVTSRGCPFNCSFCSAGALYNRTIRFRSIENIIEELSLLKNQGFKDIQITDDCFVLKKSRVIKICDAIKKEKLDINWHANGRTDTGSVDTFRNMVQAGCKTISFGFESGVQRILDYYNKKIDVKSSFDTVKAAKKARFETIFGGFIIGAPTETIQEILTTIKFAYKLDVNLFQFQLLSIDPGTPLYNNFVENGWINDSVDWEDSKIAADICPKVIKKEILEKIIEKSFIPFITSPKRLINEYLRSLTSKYRLSIFKNLPNIIKSTLKAEKS